MNRHRAGNVAMGFTAPIAVFLAGLTVVSYLGERVPLWAKWTLLGAGVAVPPLRP